MRKKFRRRIIKKISGAFFCFGEKAVTGNQTRCWELELLSFTRPLCRQVRVPDIHDALPGTIALFLPYFDKLATIDIRFAVLVINRKSVGARDVPYVTGVRYFHSRCCPAAGKAWRA